MQKSKQQETVDAARAKSAQDVSPGQPSADKAQSTADGLSGSGRRKRKSVKRDAEDAAAEAQRVQDQETADLLQTLQVLGSGATQAIDSLLGILDKMYEPAILEIAERTGKTPPSMKLREDEKQLLSFTLEKVIHKISPEWIAKYGIWLLVGMVTVTIGLPRIVIGIQLDKLTKEILRDRARQKKQDPADAKPEPKPTDSSTDVIPGSAAD